MIKMLNYWLRLLYPKAFGSKTILLFSLNPIFKYRHIELEKNKNLTLIRNF